MKTNVFEVSPEFIDVRRRAVIFHEWGYGLTNTLLHACVISAFAQDDLSLSRFTTNGGNTAFHKNNIVVADSWSWLALLDD